MEGAHAYTNPAGALAFRYQESSAMKPPEEDIVRKLARLDEAARRGGLRDMRHGPWKWAVGALCAIAAAATVVAVIEANKPPMGPPQPAKPVMIQIVPDARK
jgi:hypothetical protein